MPTDNRQNRDPRFANRDQDPGHPANTTPPSTDPGQPRPRAEAFNVPPEDLKTEQEKDAGNASQGVGPMAKSETTAGPVTTIEDQDIGPREPYPTGSPPDTAENTTFVQGIKGVTDKPSAKPGASSGPAGQAPGVHDRDAAYDADRKKDEPRAPARDPRDPRNRDPRR
jgi:hypothetical protein